MHFGKRNWRISVKLQLKFVFYGSKWQSVRISSDNDFNDTDLRRQVSTNECLCFISQQMQEIIDKIFFEMSLSHSFLVHLTSLT